MNSARSNSDGFFIGVTPLGCDFWSPDHAAGLGFFFSPRSRSMIGLDGTNFSWPEYLEELWCQQLSEQSQQELSLNRWSSGSSLRLSVETGACWCVRLSALMEFEVYYRPPRPTKGFQPNEWATCRSQSIVFQFVALVQWRIQIPSLPRAYYLHLFRHTSSLV